MRIRKSCASEPDPRKALKRKRMRRLSLTEKQASDPTGGTTLSIAGDARGEPKAGAR
jgi:hypothetical protein